MDQANQIEDDYEAGRNSVATTDVSRGLFKVAKVHHKAKVIFAMDQ